MTLKITFTDPGMKPKTVEVEESEIAKALETEALKMNYTRARFEQNGKKKFFVRALGSHEWRDYATMDSMERHNWRLQDRG